MTCCPTHPQYNIQNLFSGFYNHVHHTAHKSSHITQINSVRQRGLLKKNVGMETSSKSVGIFISKLEIEWQQSLKIIRRRGYE